MIKNKILIYAMLCSIILFMDNQHVDALQNNDNASISEYSKNLSSNLKENIENAISKTMKSKLNTISSNLKSYGSQYSIDNVQCEDTDEAFDVSIHFSPNTSVRIMSIIDIRDKAIDEFNDNNLLNKNIHIYFIDDEDGHVICDYIYDTNSGWNKKVKG